MPLCPTPACPCLVTHPPSPCLFSFTGSAGTALVTADAALLWTDGRYYLQAETELGPDWTLMRGGSGTCPEVTGTLREGGGAHRGRGQGDRDDSHGGGGGSVEGRGGLQAMKYKRNVRLCWTGGTACWLKRARGHASGARCETSPVTRRDTAPWTGGLSVTPGPAANLAHGTHDSHPCVCVTLSFFLPLTTNPTPHPPDG